MKNQIYRAIAIFSLFFSLAAVNAQAQAPSKVEVEIPFEFSAGKATLPAGVYSIKRLSGNFLQLQNVDDKQAAILNAPLNLTANDPNAVERLVFNKHDGEYYLAQIWLTSDTGRELFVRRKTAKSERIEIALHTTKRQ